MKNFVENKFAEIKKAGIIKDFRKLPNGEYDIEFYDDLPPEMALIKLDKYLFKKYGLCYG